MSPKIEEILVKFLSKSANTSELNELDRWVQRSENRPIFRNFIETHYAITIGMNEPDKNEIRERIIREIRKDKNVFRRMKFAKYLKYAAIAILLIGIGFFFREDLITNHKQEIIQPIEDNIVLELGNGETRIIMEGGLSRVTSADGNVIGQQSGNKLIYLKPNMTDKLIYNTLTIPYGKRFDIILSDGTHIFLNSGSTIKYPVSFIRGQKREIFLEGEAFFEVSHNKKDSFVVIANEMEVEVYGTKFNVTTYEEDLEASVVLISGSVGFSVKGMTSDDQVLLEPGFKGAFNRNNMQISIEKVNKAIYTSWLRGNMVFRDAPFENIIKKLERQYNVIIINNNKKLANETFNATIEVDRETIEQVFEYFKRIHQIEYQIFNNKIIIN